MEGKTQPDGIQSDTPDVDVTTSVQVDPDRAAIFYGSQEPQEEQTSEPSAEARVEQNSAQEPSEEVSGDTTQELGDINAVVGSTEQPPAEEPADPPEATGEETGEPISSWSQLVEHQEWDPEWANNLTLTQKIDGEETDVTIGELLAVNQTMEAATKRLDDAKEKSKTILEEANGQAKTQAEHLAQAAALVQLTEELVGLGQNKQAHLAKIRETQGDAAYLVEKDRLDTLQEKVDQLKSYAGTSMQEVLNGLNADMTDEARQEMAIEENAKLMERLPAWRDDPELHKQEAGELVEYLTDAYQYEGEQIKNALDHRLWDMARKAMLYDRSQEASRATRKVVRSIPMKSGGQTPAQRSDAPKTRESVFYGSK